MMRCNLFKWCQFFALVSLIAGNAYAANQADDAQQALQQLRLLQQRLSQNQGPDSQSPNDANAAGAGSTGPGKSPAPAQPTQNTSNYQGSSGNEEQVVSQNDAEVIDNKSFKDMIRSLYPLTPEQIVRLKQIYQTNEYAQASTPGTPPKPTATSQFVNLSPGSTPPVIRLSQGFVSSLVFLDSTGAPWPIAAYDLGDPAAFNIQWDKTSNTLMIQAMKLYNYGNLAVRLRGLNTPVMLTLIPGQKAVDYRVDLRVQGYGPNAKSMPLEEGIPPSANDLLLHVLDGVPPPGSQRLIVSGGDARAWLFGEKMYVRTGLTILSPGWLGSMTSADGTHAYEMQKSPVLLVSWHGKVMQLKVEGL
ncbi:type IV secretion system protein IcmK [Legionella antarctica]|uniref:Type IV secretion system protein IcmK n=1 Tax=Legionella antarctica TaxID=2708020 RepID=A0A6F8T0C1_9GAMM|nr:DotH/IcmK family type IV secretion protein [Legionella antarctica]BCA94124.1 type IV secretion system protein IcmK [Legionella antarctica]